MPVSTAFNEEGTRAALHFSHPKGNILTREIMAGLGFRSIDEMVGRSDRLKSKSKLRNWKAQKLDLAPILYQPYLSSADKLCSHARSPSHLD